jgi:hypothetical protein
MHRGKDPLEFLIMRTWVLTGEEDICINHLERLLSNYFFSTSNSILEREDISPKGSVKPSLIGIW